VRLLTSGAKGWCRDLRPAPGRIAFVQRIGQLAREVLEYKCRHHADCSAVVRPYPSDFLGVPKRFPMVSTQCFVCSPICFPHGVCGFSKTPTFSYVLRILAETAFDFTEKELRKKKEAEELRKTREAEPQNM
jgi:hypothetical protein